jgi:hypothetical protein
MTMYSPEPDTQATLAKLALDLHIDGLAGVRLYRVGDEIVLQGTVSDYAEKCRIEQQALAAGVQVRNCLRVIPDTASLPVADAPLRVVPAFEVYR